MVKCWRTMHNNLDASNCIEGMCSAYIRSGQFSGCAFVVAAQTTALVNFLTLKGDYERRNASAEKAGPPIQIDRTENDKDATGNDGGTT